MQHDHFLIFVPGIMGTELMNARGTAAVWGGKLSIMWDALAKKPRSLADNTLTPGKVLRRIEFTSWAPWFSFDVYGGLLDFFRLQLGYNDGIDFLEFGYDWRRTNAANAKQLSAKIQQLIADGATDIRIVAHSMGGLLVRLMLNDGDNASWLPNITTYVQIGTPVSGAAKAYATLKKDPNLNVLLDRLRQLQYIWDVTPYHRLLDSLLSFESIFELLPHTRNLVLSRNGTDYSALEKAAWPDQYHTRVEQAIKVHESVCKPLHVKYYCVYSNRTSTPASFEVDEYFDIVRSRRTIGDGTVDSESAAYGVDKSVRHLLLKRVGHDKLPGDSAVHELLKQFLGVYNLSGGGR